MTELEILKHAQTYIEKLSNGINPIDNSQITTDSILKNDRIVRCLSFVSSQLLKDVDSIVRVENDYCSSANNDVYKLIDKPINTLVLTENINKYLSPHSNIRVKPRKLLRWLASDGMLSTVYLPDGQKQPVPTAKGLNNGISVGTEIINSAEYSVILYNTNAQRYVFDNLDVILSSKKSERQNTFSFSPEKKDLYEYSDTPITITAIVNILNSLNESNTQKLKVTAVTKWLIDIGLLETAVNDVGKSEKVPTEIGRNLGITTVLRQSGNGNNYTLVLYNKEAQQFIVDNIELVTKAITE